MTGQCNAIDAKTIWQRDENLFAENAVQDAPVATVFWRRLCTVYNDWKRIAEKRRNFKRPV